MIPALCKSRCPPAHQCISDSLDPAGCEPMALVLARTLSALVCPGTLILWRKRTRLFTLHCINRQARRQTCHRMRLGDGMNIHLERSLHVTTWSTCGWAGTRPDGRLKQSELFSSQSPALDYCWGWWQNQSNTTETIQANERIYPSITDTLGGNRSKHRLHWRPRAKFGTNPYDRESTLE